MTFLAEHAPIKEKRIRKITQTLVVWWCS